MQNDRTVTAGFLNGSRLESAVTLSLADYNWKNGMEDCSSFLSANETYTTAKEVKNERMIV